MKWEILYGILILLAVFSLSLILKKDVGQKRVFQKRSGTAIIMTGAAARIPQEAALLEELYNRGLLKDVVFISGVSSGALNSVVLNGILSDRMTWHEYRKILFGITNSDIFIREGKKLPVNTDPEREFITDIVERRLGFHTIGDLPFMTAISITDLKDLNLKKKVYRMCSRKINKETDLSLSIVDILMASTSFPIAFPQVRIRNAKTIPDVDYIDGGVGEDHVPYYALLEFEKYRGVGVAKVFIISRKSDSVPDVSEELRQLGIDDRKIFDVIGVSIENILKKDFIKRLRDYRKDAPDLAPLTWVWVPDFKQDFLMFNFDKLQDQYELTARWAMDHDPVGIDVFLKTYFNERRKEFE